MACYALEARRGRVTATPHNPPRCTSATARRGSWRSTSTPTGRAGRRTAAARSAAAPPALRRPAAPASACRRGSSCRRTAAARAAAWPRAHRQADEVVHQHEALAVTEVLGERPAPAGRLPRKMRIVCW